MPVTPQDGGSGHGPVTIPKKYRADITNLLGYDGPWTIKAYQAREIMQQLTQAQNQGGDTGGDEGDILGDIINALGAALGSGSGGSSGSGSAGMTAKQKANLRNSYIAMLQSFDMGLTKNMKALVDQGVRQEWSTTSFLVHLRQTKDYKQHFPGIRSGGTMSEAAYNAQFRQYQEAAKSDGVQLSRQQFGTLVRKNVGINEWRMRVEFLHRSTKSKEFFNQMEIAARKLGIIKPNSQLSKKELFNAMVRKGDPRLEKLMEEANVRYLLESINFTVGPQGDIGRKALLGFVKGLEAQGIDAEGLTSQDFAGLADKMKTVIPAARRIGAGITDRDLWTLEFGGPGQQEIARHAEAILATEGAEDEMRSRAVVVEDNLGSRVLGGTPQAPKGL